MLGRLQVSALLVRRVVEARASAQRGGLGGGGGGGGAAGNSSYPQTPRLPPAQGEKGGQHQRQSGDGEEGAEEKKGFWAKLKCW